MSLIETHISWVLVGEERVYKFKKPLRFDWLDTTTIARRKDMCERELRLNRRCSTGIYERVEPVRESGGALYLGRPEGRIVDWCLIMKRMPQGKQLDRLLRLGMVNNLQIFQLARKIAGCHLASTIINKPFDRQRQQHLFADLRAAQKTPGLEPYWHQLINQGIEASDAFLRKHEADFQRRAAAGWVRDLHGDLHAANIFMLEDPVLFDCLEFSDDLRQIDVLDEIAFLCMDIESFGRPDLASQLLGNYLQNLPAMQTEDWPVFLYYQSYRANVRAKVHSLHLQQAGWSDTQQRVHRERMESYLHAMMHFMAMLSDPIPG